MRKYLIINLKFNIDNSLVMLISENILFVN